METENKEVAIVISSRASGYHIAKLGFTRKAADTTFYSKAKGIAAAIRLDVKGYYDPQFEYLDLLDRQLYSFLRSIVSIKLGGLGKVAKKNRLKYDLMGTLNGALGFINQLARDDGFNSEEIITGANLLVCGKRRNVKKELRAKQGLREDEIILYCIAEKVNGKYVDAVYYWQWSIDDGETWNNVDATDGATVIIPGMKRTSTLFRKCSKIGKRGKTAWCNPVEILPGANPRIQ